MTIYLHQIPNAILETTTWKSKKFAVSPSFCRELFSGLLPTATTKSGLAEKLDFAVSLEAD
jgi:hypothetical protein